MRKLVPALLGIALAASILATNSGTAQAAGSCSFKATPPAKVVIGAPTTTIRYVSTTTCGSYSYVAVDWRDASGQDQGSVGEVIFMPSAPTINYAYHAGDFNIIGRYTSFADSYDVGGQTLAFTSAAMTLKYSSQTYFTPSRKGSAVYVNILTKQYKPSAKGYPASPNRTVYLQRFINGGWQTMLGHTTDINGANTFGFIQAKAYNYRVITTDSTTSWGRTGGAAAK
jgi:hypothetical protein